MTDCKNCKYTDEYCASGDCPHDKTNYDILKEYEAHQTLVPSYEEWKAKLEENTQLKELLKECFIAINEGSYFDQCDILTKIDEVLK